MHSISILSYSYLFKIYYCSFLIFLWSRFSRSFVCCSFYFFFFLIIEDRNSSPLKCNPQSSLAPTPKALSSLVLFIILYFFLFSLFSHVSLQFRFRFSIHFLLTLHKVKLSKKANVQEVVKAAAKLPVIVGEISPDPEPNDVLLPVLAGVGFSPDIL